MKERVNEMKIIKLDNINKFFGSKENKQQILRGISLDIEKGELIAIMGPSGSGKSTMLNVLGLLDGNYSGEYILDDMKVSSLKNNELAEIRNKKIGFVFQNFNLIKELSAQENVKMSLDFSNIYKNRKEKIGRKDMNKKAKEALELVGLKSHVNKKPNQLSGGQQQRVAIARALINNPDILLADEPTGSVKLVQHYPKTTPVIFWSLSMRISLMTDRQSVRFSSRVKVS